MCRVVPEAGILLCSARMSNTNPIISASFVIHTAFRPEPSQYCLGYPLSGQNKKAFCKARLCVQRIKENICFMRWQEWQVEMELPLDLQVPRLFRPQACNILARINMFEWLLSPLSSVSVIMSVAAIC